MLQLLSSSSVLPSLPVDVFPQIERGPLHVISLVLDGLGWQMLHEHGAHRHPFFERILSEGKLSKLTAQFPSTTTAEMTTLYSGLPVGKTGVCEWRYFEPRLDETIIPLLCAFPDIEARPTFRERNISMSDVLPPTNIFEMLARDGIPSNSIDPAEYATRQYNPWMTRGATRFGYESVDQGFAILAERIRESARSTYSCLYVPCIDSTSHVHGPHSQAVHAQILSVLDSAANALFPAIDQARVPVALFVFADHGQTQVDPDEAILLNSQFPALMNDLKTTGDGRPILFSGGVRDFFLHIRDDRVNFWTMVLSDFLGDRAEVVPLEALYRDGLFGSDAHPETLTSRLGTLAVLPRMGISVDWAGSDGRYRSTYRGHHGGLSAEEMEIPFGVLYAGNRSGM